MTEIHPVTTTKPLLKGPWITQIKWIRKTTTSRSRFEKVTITNCVNLSPGFVAICQNWKYWTYHERQHNQFVFSLQPYWFGTCNWNKGKKVIKLKERRVLLFIIITYQPRSDSLTCLKCKFQVSTPSVVTDTLPLWVTTLVSSVNIVWSSARIHPTLMNV